MAIRTFGAGGNGGAGARVRQAHDETLGGGATWHWPLDGSEVESVVGGSPVDLTATSFLWNPGANDDSVQSLDAGRSQAPIDTGTIGASVRIQGAVTAAAWVMRRGASGGNLALLGVRITGAGEANNIQWEIGFVSADHKPRVVWQDGAADNLNILNATNPLADLTWTHLCITRDVAGTACALYVNGVLDVSGTGYNKATGGTNISKVSVACNSSSTEFAGNIFSPIVFEEEMDAAGVLALYNSTSSTGSW